MLQITDLSEPVFASVNYDSFNGIKIHVLSASVRARYLGKKTSWRKKASREKSRGICNTIAHPITQSVAGIFR